MRCLKKHIAGYEHNPSTLKGAQQLVFNCPICGLTYEKLLPLTEHIKVGHPKALAHKYYPCFYCKQIFLASEDYQKHINIECSYQKRAEHKGKSKNTDGKSILFIVWKSKIYSFFFKVALICVKCQDEFKNEEDLLCHDIVAHLEMKERFAQLPIFSNILIKYFLNLLFQILLRFL
jgi:uncharacterized C2H2 Zn-finger protein